MLHVGLTPLALDASLEVFVANSLGLHQSGTLAAKIVVVVVVAVLIGSAVRTGRLGGLAVLGREDLVQRGLGLLAPALSLGFGLGLLLLLVFGRVARRFFLDCGVIVRRQFRLLVHLLNFKLTLLGPDHHLGGGGAADANGHGAA